jgi:hypothetical protein
MDQQFNLGLYLKYKMVAVVQYVVFMLVICVSILKTAGQYRF